MIASLNDFMTTREAPMRRSKTPSSHSNHEIVPCRAFFGSIAPAKLKVVSATFKFRTVEVYCSSDLAMGFVVGENNELNELDAHFGLDNLPEIRPNDYRYKNKRPRGKAKIRFRKEEEKWREEALEYVDAANKLHAAQGTLMSGALEYAKRAGKYLLAAKSRTKTKEWTKFLKEHFKGSVETARVYMRVANKWNDPRISEARRGGMEPESIKGFLKIVSNAPPEKEITFDSKIEERKDGERAILREYFAVWLKKRELVELELMDSNFDDLFLFFEEYLQHVVCMTVEADYYHEPEWVRWRSRVGEISRWDKDRLLDEWKEQEKREKQVRKKTKVKKHARKKKKARK
jgi:hypothetical protein